MGLAMLVLPRLSPLPSLLVECTVGCMAPPTTPQLPTLTSTPLPSPTCTLRSQLSPTLMSRSLPSLTSTRSPLPLLLQSSPVTLLSQLLTPTTTLLTQLLTPTT